MATFYIAASGPNDYTNAKGEWRKTGARSLHAAKAAASRVFFSPETNILHVAIKIDDEFVRIAVRRPSDRRSGAGLIGYSRRPSWNDLRIDAEARLQT